MMRRLAVLSIVLPAVLSCRGRERAGSGAGAPMGTLVIVAPAGGDIGLLLPPIVTTQIGFQVTDRIFPRLADLGLGLNTVDDSGFVPSLAASWEHRDSLTIAFKLDPRARWLDGAPITAADVAYTFGVYRDTVIGSVARLNLTPITSVTDEDSLTAVFRFTHWYPEQLYDAVFHMRIVPKHALDSIPNARLASSSFATDPAIGAGPFRFARWEQGTSITIEADTTWFLGRPRLARIVWRMVPDVSSSVTALLAGEADAMEVIPQRDEVERVRQSTEITLMPYASPFVAGIAFNMRRPLFQDRALRRAIVQLVDREAVVQSVFGPYAEVPIGPTSRMVWISQAPARSLGLDTAAAARTLDSLGWRRGTDGIRQRGGRKLGFTLLVPSTSRSRQEASVLIQGQLARAGIELRIESADMARVENRLRSGDFDATFFNRTLDPTPANIKQFWHSDAVGGDNWGAYRSARFDSLYAAAMAAHSRAEALPRWQALMEWLSDDAPVVHIFSLRNNAAIHRRFQNVTIRPDNWLATVATWSVAPDQQLPRDR